LDAGVDVGGGGSGNPVVVGSSVGTNSDDGVVVAVVSVVSLPEVNVMITFFSSFQHFSAKISGFLKIQCYNLFLHFISKTLIAWRKQFF
jgi:hypothetical protein